MNFEKKQICVFGTYEPRVLRNQVIIQSLEDLDIKLEFVNFKLPNFQGTPLISYLFKTIKQIFNLIKALRNIKSSCLFILYPGIISVIIAKIFSNKKIIFDPFISIYEANVYDYKVIQPKSLVARLYYYLELNAFKKADIIIADTNEHIKLYKKLFYLKNKKIFRLFVGTNSYYFEKMRKELKRESEKKEKKDTFKVSFIGNYIPLQGVEYILKSFNYLGKYKEKIVYELVGGNKEIHQKYENFIENLGINKKNIKFLDPIPFEELPYYIEKTDIQLGIFGDTEKTKRVIPNKAFVAIAAGKPLISARTKAIIELFHDRKDILLCNIADPKDLAEKILILYKNSELRNKIAKGGYSLFQKKVHHIELSKILKEILKEQKCL